MQLSPQQREDRLNTLTANLAEYTRELFLATAALATLTGITVIFSMIQLYYARRAIQEAGRSANIAERALTELERPWMIDEAAPWEIEPVAVDAVPYLSLVFKNVGRAPAVISQCLMCSVPMDTAPKHPDYTGAVVLGITREIAQSDQNAKSIAFRPANMERQGRVLCYGVLEYRALGGTQYKTGFAVHVICDSSVNPPLLIANPIAKENYTYQS